MTNSDPDVGGRKSLVKGLVAGLIGGLAGTVAKTFAERMFPPRTHDEAPPSELAPVAKATTPDGIHWGFGAATGAAYGALVEFYPAASAREGAGFGLALQSLTHEGSLPALDLPAEPEGGTIRERASETTAHVVYGVTTEMVRRIVRKFL